MRRAGANQRWVCYACGKYTEPGAPRDALGDSACIVWALLCDAARGDDGRWLAVGRADEIVIDATVTPRP